MKTGKEQDYLRHHVKFTIFRRSFIILFSIFTFSNAMFFFLTAEDDQITTTLKAASIFYVSIAIGFGTLSNIFVKSVSEIEAKSYAIDVLLLLAISFLGYWMTITGWGIGWQRAALLIGVVIIIYLIYVYSFNLFNSMEEGLENVEDVEELEEGALLSFMRKLFSNGVVDLIANQIPVVGTVMRTLSDQRFEKRLQENKEKIEKIVNMVPIHEREYFLGKVGRTVFERIEADDQDGKAKYLLNGFENCVRREMRDGSQVLYYFDLVSALRMNDFIFLEDISDNQNIIDKDDELVKFSINNLLNHGMISLNGISRDMLQGPHDIHYRDFKITPIGKELLEFIKPYDVGN